MKIDRPSVGYRTDAAPSGLLALTQRIADLLDSHAFNWIRDRLEA